MTGLAIAVPSTLMAVIDACASQAQVTGAPQGGQKITTLLVAVQGADTRTLDPQDAGELSTPLFLRALYDQLLTFPGSDVSQVTGDLAANWTISPDGLTYVFNLNPEAKFSDGSPLTPEDVVFSLSRHKYLLGPTSWFQDSVESVEKTGDHQVTMKLSSVDVGMLYTLATPLVSIGRAATMQANGAKSGPGTDKTDTARTWLDGHSVGTGPFVLEKWEQGSQITMTSNPYYWGPKLAFDRIVFKLTQDQTAQRDLLKRGDAHIAINLSPDLVAGLEGDPNIGILTVPAEGFAWLAMHVSNNPALAIPKNWEAVKYAIDYDGMAKIYKGGGRLVASCIPQGMANALPVEERIKQDLQRAKTALQAAGNPDGFTFKMSYAADQYFENVAITDIVQKVAADLQGVGIKPVLNPLPASQELTDFRAGKLESTCHGWGADYLGWTDFLPNFAPGGNVAGKRQAWQPTQSPEAKQIADQATQAMQTVDAGTQKDLCLKAQRLMNEVGPHAWLFEMVSQIGYRKDILATPTTNPTTYVEPSTIAPKA